MFLQMLCFGLRSNVARVHLPLCSTALSKFSAVVWLACNLRFFCVAFSKPCGRAVGSDGEASCERPARRRRERRLRSWLRHERQSVAMALGRGRDLSSRKQRASRAWEVVIGKAHRDTSTADNLTKSSMCQYHRSGGKSCRLFDVPIQVVEEILEAVQITEDIVEDR